MNKDIEAPINYLVDEVAKTPYCLHYVRNLPSHCWMEFKDELLERMQGILQPEREIPLRVNCNFVETEQVALKLICELYDALNSDKELAYRLSPEYRQNYVAIYTPLKSKMKYIVKRGNSTRRQIEQNRSTQKTNGISGEIKIVLPPVTGDVTANRNEVIGRAIKTINEWARLNEHTTESIPEPLDLTDAVNLVCKLLEELEKKNLLFYYGNWDSLKRQFRNDLARWKWGAIFTDLRHILSQSIGTRRRALPEKFRETGTRRIHPIFFIYIDRSSMDSQISRKQLEALAANSKAFYVVFIQ